LSGARRRWLVATASSVAISILGAGLYLRPHVRHAGTVTRARVPSAALGARSLAHRGAVPGTTGPVQTEVLFGDLHVHTTFSTDAFAWSLPLVHGEGAHPPADACDFARFCSSLDFFALTDHAESLTTRRWNETKASIRECNAAAGDPKSPDIVAYTGFEWTQVGLTRETHYGHRNVVFRDDSEDRLPVRAIAAGGKFAGQLRGPSLDARQLRTLFHDLPHRQEYLDWSQFQRENRAAEPCARGVDVHALPPDCQETADTPQELFEKLAQWGHPVLAIPHGTTWGLYTPPGTTFTKQLTRQMTDPERQTLFEIYSGHGSAEAYRPFKAIDFDAQGNAVCPAPTADYEPCCFRAGELIRARCGDAPAAECEKRVSDARTRYLAAGASGHHAVPGATVEDWKDCGQCRDCFQPAFSYRPGNAGQAILATTDFSDPAAPVNHTFGFVGSSDNHKARPGTGYKAYARREMTEATGAVDDEAREQMHVHPGDEKPAEAVSVDPLSGVFANGFARMEFERSSSFYTTGGLVGVHSNGRSREAIWEALRQRRVYATSGERILLWFSLVNGRQGEVFMGSEARLGSVPQFSAHAVGSFVQKPGCPDWSGAALGAGGVERLCRGECYNPTDARHRITRIEIVRIRPQKTPGEPLGQLIEDPWRVLPCSASAADCTVQFEDPEFGTRGRDTTYYVRAIQEPTPEVNGAGLRCDRDAQGRCVSSHPCYSDYRTSFDDNCLSPVEERAWSSPIFVRWDGGTPPTIPGAPAGGAPAGGAPAR
jgi:hypothetical protein